MTTHTDLIARLRVLSYREANICADALEAQDTTVEALRAEVAALTRAVDTDYEQLFREEAAKVAALTKEHEFACEIGADYRDRWMAAQAREAKLRWYLENYRGQVNQYGQETASTALALPTDDSALMERMKEERERCAKLVDSCWDDSCCLEESPMLHNLAAAIRGLA